MAKLKSDERICPFCAETIKASAIKCRYCQSEVIPVATPDPEPETVPAAAAPPPPPPPTSADTETTEAPATGRSWTLPSVEDVWQVVQRRLTLVLAVAVLLAAAGVGFGWWRAEQGSAEVAPDGALVGDAARMEVLVTAADLTQRVLSYSHSTFDNDMEVARARLTPSFRKEYDATMAQVRDNTEKNKIALDAAVVSSAIIEATEHRAKVLVFLNQSTTAGTGKDNNQQQMRNSLVVSLSRGEGDWNMSKLTALG